VAFVADRKGGPFDVPGDQTREWLLLPANPNGRSNADVLKPWVNGMNVTRPPAGKRIVDSGWTMSDADPPGSHRAGRRDTQATQAPAERDNPRLHGVFRGGARSAPRAIQVGHSGVSHERFISQAWKIT